MSLNQIIFTILLYSGGSLLLIFAVFYAYSRISSLSNLSPQLKQSNQQNSQNYYDKQKDDYNKWLKYSLQTSNNQIGEYVNQGEHPRLTSIMSKEDRQKSIPRYEILNK